MAGVHDLLLEWMPRNSFFVDLDTEPRLLRNLPEAVLHANRSAHHFVIARHRTGHFFLDYEVRRRDIEMQGGDAGKRTKRIMWSNANPRRVRHGCDLACFGKAANVAQIRLRNVD